MAREYKGKNSLLEMMKFTFEAMSKEDCDIAPTATPRPLAVELKMRPQWTTAKV
jgi:hypothetical protein